MRASAFRWRGPRPHEARSRAPPARRRWREMRGLVSIGDLIKARLNSTELEAWVLRDMARSELLGPEAPIIVQPSGIS